MPPQPFGRDELQRITASLVVDAPQQVRHSSSFLALLATRYCRCFIRNVSRTQEAISLPYRK